MDSRTYYYARVSSREQNLDRQIAAFKALGAEDRDIVTDKDSGKDLERAGYQALKNAMLRRGDTLVIKSLDRLSRNKSDIKNELQFFKDSFGFPISSELILVTYKITLHPVFICHKIVKIPIFLIQLRKQLRSGIFTGNLYILL